ncbi:HET-domain-containing protein [Acephala macrosclerotiorum]|nr:HET-domain-containing protein [Acephala macrosclerotiorum]
MNSSLVRAQHSKDSSPDSPDHEKRQQRNKRQKTSALSQLCAQCKQLDLDKSFEEASEAYQKVKDGSRTLSDGLQRASDGRNFYDNAILVHKFQDRLSRPSNCPLCNFFQSLRIQSEAHERFKLLAFRSSESWMFRLDVLQACRSWDVIQDTVFMAVVPDDELIPSSGHEENWLEKDIPTLGAIYHLRADESSDANPNILLRARELGEKANLGLVRSWLETCREHHHKACGRPEPPHEPIARGFRVINCNADTLTIEEQPWGVTYAALSYVWGSRPADKEDCASTILDSIEVTRELGLQYLWIDRLCINQSDEKEKAYLISRMTTIYEEADFTIIAAAGSGASDGLPGIRSSHRKPQPKYKLDSGSLLVSTLPDPRRDIFRSDYWTRGWTYQEGVLSKRRIAFTDHQIYWECQSMATHESINLPLFLMPSTVDEDSELRMADFMLTGIFKGDSYSGGSLSNDDELVIVEDDDYRLDYGFPIHREATTRAQLRGLNEHIRAFSKRKLSYETDALPAFRGILGMYKQNELLYLLHGIPMWLGDICGDETGAQITLALSVASWYHRAGPDHQMFVSEPCQRRSHLPSWTWAGWDGPVTWRAPPNYEHGAFMSDLIAIENLQFLWAVDMYLHTPDQWKPIRLLNTYSADRLESENPTLIEIKDPFTLKYSIRRDANKKEWEWVRIAGRSGRERFVIGSSDWDTEWYRIAGRLCFIALSVPMTEDEWTKKHASGELISVLMFASQEISTEHARARFLTLRRVAAMAVRWERVGILSLTIPEVSLSKCTTNGDFLKQIPVRERGEGIVIQ